MRLRKLFIIGTRQWNTASRARGAEREGWEICWSRPSWAHRLPQWRRLIQYRLRFGLDITIFNRLLIDDIKAIKPHVIWVEDPIFIYRSTLEMLKRNTKAALVCAYSDDPRDRNKKSRHFDNSISIYDVIFVTKDELIQRFFGQGCKYPTKFWKGYDPQRIYPIKLSTAENNEYESNVTFIGHADFVRRHPMRLRPLEALARAIPNTNVWGKSWGKVSWDKDLRNTIHPYQIEGTEYTKAICAAKIALQIPSRLARDTHSSRSVEIPACGTLMLAERTVDHQLLFEEDKEAVFFNSITELVDKAKFYVENDYARKRLAEAGYNRCIRSGYSNYERMKQMLAQVEKVMGGRWSYI